MKVIFLSNQLFDFPLKTNKWHVATRVAKRGHQVLFVDPPIRLRKLAKQVFEGRWSLRRILTGSYGLEVGSRAKEKPSRFKDSNLEGWGIGVGGGSVGLKRAGNSPEPDSRLRQETGSSPCQPFSSLTVFTPLTRSVSESPNLIDFNVNRVRSRFPELFDGSAILWVYNPAMIEYIEKIPRRLLVYDCVDDYPSMANYARLGLSEKIARREREVATRADVVFATTRRLAQKLSKYNNNVHYVGNAGDYNRFSPVGKIRLFERFKRVQPAPGGLNPSFDIARGRGEGVWKRVEPWEGFNPIGKPRIGFTGAIDEYKLNLPLLVRIAKTYPDHSLVLIGPQGVADSQPDLFELKKLPNVHIIEQRPYEEMPAFFAGFDCYVIPYNLNDYTLKGCFPVKFFDALAAGLPTIVSNLLDYEPFADVCYIAKSDEEFSKAIQIALLEDSPEKIQARMCIARENSWDKKVDRMLGIVSDKLAVEN